MVFDTRSFSCLVHASHDGASTGLTMLTKFLCCVSAIGVGRVGDDDTMQLVRLEVRARVELIRKVWLMEFQ